MSSNFQFLAGEWPQIFSKINEAERLCFISPSASVVLSRGALELTLQWLFENEKSLHPPYQENLNTWIHDSGFQRLLRPGMFQEINLVRKIGNGGAHGGNAKREESLMSLKNMYRFLTYMANCYFEQKPTITAFQEDLIPTGEEEKLQRAQIERLLELIENERSENKKKHDELLKKAEEVASLRASIAQNEQQLATRRTERQRETDFETQLPPYYTEAETRKKYIDVNLKEAGWKQLRQGYELEFEVTGMPESTNKSGKGYVDYVLWGNNGKPLAVVEAKKSLNSPREGKQQAFLYANCLEKMFGQRPVIFYTNGFETFIWDDTFYPERQIHGFLTRDELQRLIDRRSERLDLRTFKINEEIAGRKYQKEALARVAEAFSRQNQAHQLTGGTRKALLVMATGSGKTRTAAAIVDMLFRCHWVKRVLFLADRKELVRQAKTAFNQYLPQLSAINLVEESEDVGTRLVFSTYPTMLNKIDQSRIAEERFYGPGHFDLIIIDEAHRSVYQKYGAIFEYFDSLLLGLTATPRREIDRNTYGLFELEEGNPTFAYELDQAIRDKFLVPAKGIDVPIQFLRQGITYADLSEDERAEYEEKFGDPVTGEVPDHIDSSDLNEWLFNEPTVDIVLKYLMEKGIKVQGGDKLGKSIIFAKNHDHAIFIEKRFNILFPEFAGHFLRVIDNYESKAEDLLLSFKDDEEEKLPQIAVSVDMMDTGVDAPRVVNLVFFKAVKSQTKFWQMIGRGTRLRPNLFGPNLHKTEFLIFDYCQNFEFFGLNPEGISSNRVKPLAQQIFEAKLEVIYVIQNLQDAEESKLELANWYRNELHKEVSSLSKDRFEVKMYLRAVERFENRNEWEDITIGKIAEIKNQISRLIRPVNGDHELARRFDLVVLRLILAQLTARSTARNYRLKINDISQKLLRKLNIPAVNEKAQILSEIQQPVFWQSVSEKRLEEIRQELRDLMKFLDREDKVIVYSNIEDELDEANIREVELPGFGNQFANYRERVEAYIRENKTHITIDKLRKNLPITGDELEALERLLFDGDERGTRTQFEKEFGTQPLGKFIRSIVGLEIEAANQAFSEFLNLGNLRADQITFINNIIMHLEKNGTIDPGMLFESPFTDVNDQGLIGVFDDADAAKVVSIISEINHRAEVG